MVNISKEHCIILPATEIAVGHCCIVNHCDQPSGSLVAVVVGIESETVLFRYLNSDPRLSRYNQPSFRNPAKSVTPVAWFGVDVIAFRDPQGGPTVYWCEEQRPSEAKYSDGQPRQWQERGMVGQYIARSEVLKIVLDVMNLRHVAAGS